MCCRLLPAAQQQFELLVPADQRCGGRAQRFEAAGDAAWPPHPPGWNELGTPVERHLPKIVAVEQVADELAGACRYYDSSGLGDLFQAARKLRCLANKPQPIRAIAEEIANHDRAGSDTDAQPQGAGAAAIELRHR